MHSGFLTVLKYVQVNQTVSGEKKIQDPWKDGRSDTKSKYVRVDDVFNVYECINMEALFYETDDLWKNEWMVSRMLCYALSVLGLKCNCEHNALMELGSSRLFYDNADDNSVFCTCLFEEQPIFPLYLIAAKNHKEFALRDLGNGNMEEFTPEHAFYIVHPDERDRMPRILEGTDNPMYDLVHEMRYGKDAIRMGTGTELKTAKRKFEEMDGGRSL